jgi:hypothetical protein
MGGPRAQRLAIRYAAKTPIAAFSDLLALTKISIVGAVATFAAPKLASPMQTAQGSPAR